MRKAIILTISILIFLGAGSSLFYKYFYTVPPEFISGQKVEETYVAEWEDLNSPKFQPAIDMYLSNMKAYKALPMLPIASTDSFDYTAAQIYPLLVEQFKKDTNSADIVDKLGEKPLRSLSLHLAVMLARSAGLSNNDYLHAELAAPIVLPNLPRLQFFAEDFEPSITPMLKNNGNILEIFDKAFAATQKFRNNSNQVVAWCDNSAGFFAVMDATKKPCTEADGSFFQSDDRFDDAQAQLFRGRNAQGSLVFVTDYFRSTPQTMPELDDKFLRSDANFIVTTKGHDYYPISFHSYYNAKQDRWWLIYANCYCSLRMATSPMRVY